jgi:hypothetical protein
MPWSLERLIKGGDVTGECDAGTPGSDGASPYPENVPNVPYLRVILVSPEIFVVKTELMPLQKR